MSNACTYAPSKGTDLFYALKKQLGYKKAWEVYGIVMGSKFQNDYGDSLSFDAEGVPSFSSVMSNPYIKNFIGDGALKESLQSQFKSKEDTLSNYAECLQEAYKFNSSDPNNKKFTAIVDYSGDNITVRLVFKSKAADEKFSEQYKTHQLNTALAGILQPLGNNIVGLLNEAEVGAGRTGVTDFSKARRMAQDTESLIRIANNKEGAEALSEEFSHLIIGALDNHPLVSRSIGILSTDEDALRQILGSDYDDVVEFHGGRMAEVAEEALGKLLQRQLKVEFNTKSTSLIKRLFNLIKGLFKGVNPDNVSKAVREAESSMNFIAKGLLNSNIQVTKADINRIDRDVQFNDLSDRIARNIKILKEAKNTELKRAKIAPENQDTIKGRVDDLNTYINDETKDSVLGLMNYAGQAIRELHGAMTNLKNTNGSSADMFKRLRSVQMTLTSYGGFITALNDALNDEEFEQDNMFAKKYVVSLPSGTEEINLAEDIEKLNTLQKRVAQQYLKVAKASFSEFLKPFLGEEITFTLGKNAGTTITVKELLEKADSDISFFDMWLDAMGDSSDILLQAFDAIVKKAMDAARLKAIDKINELQKIRLDAEKLGITDFDWMFERYSDGTLTGNYVGDINYAQYERDLKEFNEELDKKYGKRATGEAARKKVDERNAWIDNHTKAVIFGTAIPKASIYGGNLDKLTPNQKIIYDRIIKFKKEIDDLLPENKVETLKAVQSRKDGIQRIIDSTSSPSSLWENLKTNMGKEFIEMEDDDALFGNQRTGLRNFSGQEFMTLPVLYTTRLKDPNELSTDIFGSLIAYTAMGARYEQMEKIVDPLEVGRTVVKERYPNQTRGSSTLKETFTQFGEKVTNVISKGSGSNIERRLDDFFECQVYGRYLKDEGTFDIFGKKVNKTKLTSWILKNGSIAQLGFNWLANIANVNTGIAMQNIEAAAGEFFSVKELALADKEYMAHLTATLGELYSRNKKDKLALFDELFNIKGEFNKNMRFADQRRNLLKRVFGEGIAFLGQECGDHWLYNRTAIAMALRTKVIVPGKGEMSLWDALEVKDKYEDTSEIKELVLPKGTTTIEGELFDIGKFGRKMLHVNQSLFGVYNDEDTCMANRVIAGRLIMQYRKWMKAQYNKRFQASQMSLALGREEEGYYRTGLRIAMELARGKVQIGALDLTPHEKANIKRCMMELGQLLAVWALASLVEWPDDKDRPWALKLAEYSSKRLRHELATLAPGPWMSQEIINTVKSPAASLNLATDVTNLTLSCFDPRDWTDEIKSGPYKGWSTLEKNLYKAPIPGLREYKQVDKFVDEIDTSINYYARTSTR